MRRDSGPRAERAPRRRVFFALWPDDEFCARLAAVSAPLLSGLEGRRLGAADWHVTLCFIGSVDETVLINLQERAAALTAPAFALQFDRIEYWPEARVVAATADQVPPEALELARSLRELARSIGLFPDDKPLRPHLTLMRGVQPLAWRTAQLPRTPVAKLELAFAPSELHLAESRPSDGRATDQAAVPAAHKYSSLAHWPLSTE
jgi:2'-5' RNA ligase